MLGNLAGFCCLCCFCVFFFKKLLPGINTIRLSKPFGSDILSGSDLNPNCLKLTLTRSYLQTVGPKSGPIPDLSRSKLFDTLIVFLKEFFETLISNEVGRRQQKHEKELIFDSGCKNQYIAIDWMKKHW